jgi:hypothetical protein
LRNIGDSLPASGPKFAGLDFVYITPNPGFPGLVRADERVLGFTKVLGSVLVLG